MKSLMLSVIEMRIVVSPTRCSVLAMRVEDLVDSRAQLRSDGGLSASSAVAILPCSLTTRSPVSRCPNYALPGIPSYGEQKHAARNPDRPMRITSERHVRLYWLTGKQRRAITR